MILIVRQGNASSELPRVVFVATFVVVLAASAILAALTVNMHASTLFSGFATGGLAAMGVLGLFSIGLPLLVGAGLAVAMTMRLVGSERPALILAVAATLAAVLVAIVGLWSS